MSKDPIGFLTPDQQRISALELENEELKEQAHFLKLRIIELEAATRENKPPGLNFNSPFYYAENDPIPHCPRCWEVDNKAVHFPPPFHSAAGPSYTCPQCEKRIIHPHSIPQSDGGENYVW